MSKAGQSKAKSPDGDTCDTCRFWVEDFEPGSEGRSGECKAGPPTALVCGEDIITLWPCTEPEKWCGAHKPRLQ